MEKKILITGASGFVGSFIVEEALRRGMETWVAVRGTSSHQFLTDERIHFLEIDLSARIQTFQRLSEVSFDYVVHAAGLTKTTNPNDFFRVNTLGTRNLVDALKDTQKSLQKMVYMSSLSIFGPIHEQQPYQEITEADEPQPNTVYGESKLLAEKYLEAAEAPFPIVVLRPTGIYGPREKDYFMMAKSIKAHTDFSVGFRQQDITFVYVKDVVDAVFLALEKGAGGRKYFLSDGQVYQSSTFSNLIKQELGSPWCLHITAPIWLLRVVTWCGEGLARLTGRVSALNNDKFHILRQRNWRCDIEPARRELGYNPKYQLEQGVKETIAWYKEQGWL